MADEEREFSVSGLDKELADTPSRGAALLDQVWYLFSSIKFALILLLILTVGSFIGLMIPQNGTPAEYVTKYGAFWQRVILFWQVDNTFYSWWYVGLEVLIGASIIVCSINRLPIAWKLAYETKFIDSPRAYEVNPIRDGFAAGGIGVAEAADAVRARLRKRGYGVKVRPGDAADAAVVMSAGTGAHSRMMPYVIHIGLELILLGGVMGALTAFSIPANVPSGGSAKVPGYPDDHILVHKFQIISTPQGDVKDYITDATVFEKGKPARDVQIRVNHPLVVHGIHYYQATYSQDPSQIEMAQVQLAARSDKPALGRPVTVTTGAPTRVPGTPYSIRVKRFVPDFQVDQATREVSTRSGEPNNPAVQLEVYQDGRLLFDDWVFRNMDIHIVPHEVEAQLTDYAAPPGEPGGFAHATIQLRQGPQGEELKRLAAMPPMVRLQQQMQGGGLQALAPPQALPLDSLHAVPGTPYAVRLTRYVSDFSQDSDGQVFSRSLDANNPAVFSELYEDGTKISEGWTFLNQDAPFAQASNVLIQFLGYKPTYVTGLQVAKNPGAPLLFVGFIVFGLGLLPMTILYTHRQVFVRVDAEPEGGVVVRMAGRTYKNKRGFELHFHALAREMAADMGVVKEDA